VGLRAAGPGRAVHLSPAAFERLAAAGRCARPGRIGPEEWERAVRAAVRSRAERAVCAALAAAPLDGAAWAMLAGVRAATLLPGYGPAARRRAPPPAPQPGPPPPPGPSAAARGTGTDEDDSDSDGFGGGVGGSSRAVAGRCGCGSESMCALRPLAASLSALRSSVPPLPTPGAAPNQPEPDPAGPAGPGRAGLGRAGGARAE
jgi:hypothetical protein